MKIFDIKGAIEGVSGVVDKFVMSKDEKARLKNELEKQISERWAADMHSDSWLSKNVRPLSLIYVLFVFSVLAFTDGNVGEFKVQKEYLPIFNVLLVTVVGGYFAVRSVDKRKK